MNSIWEHGKDICRILHDNGFEAFFVGGVVRDKLLNQPIYDLDIATNAIPQETMRLFSPPYIVFPIGEKFGTIQVYISKDERIEITTYRSEKNYTDRRHPDIVIFEKELIKDLSRRDFTINAMAYNPLTDELIDPFNGQKDLVSKLISAVGNPDERFNEDPLRMMRACRFSGKLGFEIDSYTYRSIWNNHGLIKEVAAERVKEELFRMLEIENPVMSLLNLYWTDLLEDILPEVSQLDEMKQPPFAHKYDVMFHMFETVRFISPTNPLLRFAGLIHDIGKCKPYNNPPPYFPYHIEEGVKMLDDILLRLKFSSTESNYIKFLVGHHMDSFINGKNMTANWARRYLLKNGGFMDYLEDLCILIKADIKASGYDKPNALSMVDRFYSELSTAIENRKNQPFSRKDLKVNGYDLLDIGFPADHLLGVVLDALVNDVIEYPEHNIKEYLLDRAKSLYTTMKLYNLEV